MCSEMDKEAWLSADTADIKGEESDRYLGDSESSVLYLHNGFD